ncbi:hypothetical protein GCM10027446_28140 [Angustibacter peucedani]
MTTSETLDGALRTDGEHRAVRFERDYPTAVPDLWSAVTEPERLARWLDPVSGDLRVGGRVTVHFDNGEAQFEVVTCEPPQALEVRWQHGERASCVRVEITALDDGRSRLVLDHTALDPASAPGYAAGWHWHLDALAAVLRDEPAPPWDGAFDRLHAGYSELAEQL